MSATLPNDILNMIAVELRDRHDFGTLFQFSRASKQLAALGLPCLYRLADLAPAHFQSGESLDPSIAVGRHSWAYRGLVLRGSLEMSTFSQGTIFPYARYIRVLNLQDLASLLDEIASFSVSKRKELQRLDKRIRKNSTIRIREMSAANDIPLDIRQHGDLIIPHANYLEELGGPLSIDHLTAWLPRLQFLQTLRLYEGSPLYAAKDLLLEHCPYFRNVFFLQWGGKDPATDDQQLASFLQALGHRGLQSLEIAGTGIMHSLSVLALMHHNHSLVTLKLGSGAINGLAIAELPKTGTLMHLETLELSFPLDIISGDQDLAEELQAKIGKWIQSCSKLRSLALSDFISVARMLRTILDSDHIKLRRLRIQGNTRFMTKEFYDSLNSHISLRELILNYKPPLDSEFEFQPALLWKLTELRVLSFAWISEDFDDAQISVIPGLHPKLEEFSVIGDGVTDRIWDSMATLKGLSKLAIAGFSMFTCKGISEFLDTIGNKPLDLEISAAHRGILGERYDVGKLRERFTALGGSLQILDDVDDDDSDWSVEDD